MQKIKLNRRHFVIGSSLLAATSAAPQVSRSETVGDQWNGGPTMRSSQAQTPVYYSSEMETPSPEIIALNRMAFGPRPGDIEQFMALGETSEARLAAYIEEQLSPEVIDDSLCDEKLAAQNFITMDKSLGELWASYAIADVEYDDHYRPYHEVKHAAFIRGIYSKRQLLEVLADHWHNHFNVYGSDYWVAPIFAHYDRDVIRQHVLGNFRQMLEAVATSPEMLYYLDNQSNTAAGPNENFARELFELHTMGAENYLGVIPDRADVPTDEQDRPVGYIDKDVYQATEAFTGWMVDKETGQFDFDGSVHSRYDKTVLNTSLGDFQGVKDGQLVLDLLASHPGTARFICRKLCRRLVSDHPPVALVAKAAAVFMENLDAEDQLKQVVETILMSEEFSTTWGEKMKRPFEYIVSILRATQADFEPESDFFWNYERTGQPLFGWHPPNGYPDFKESWSGTMPMLQRWRLCNWVIRWNHEADEQGEEAYRLRFIEQMPDEIKSANGIVNYWISRLIGYGIPESERAAMVDIMAHGRNPDYDLPDDQIAERLRYMVGLLLMAPSFQLR